MFESPLEFIIKFLFVCLAAQDEYVRTDLLLGQREKTEKTRKEKHFYTNKTSVCAPQKHMQLEVCSQTLYLTHRNAKRQEDKKQPACENTIREPGV